MNVLCFIFTLLNVFVCGGVGVSSLDRQMLVGLSLHRIRHWSTQGQGKNHFEFLNAFTGVSVFFHVTQRSFLMREKREMESLEGNSGGKWSEEIESEIMRLSVLH